MRLVDAHCHLESELYDGRLDSIIEDARVAGLAAMITSSITPAMWDLSLALADRYDVVYASTGIHPWYIRDGDMGRIEGLADTAGRGAVAIGEIGLDRKVESPPFDLQVKIFEAQLATAKEIDLPVIIHCRGAFNELILSLKKIGVPSRGGTVHSFAGSAEIAIDLMRLGMSFSLGGILTYRNSAKRVEMLKKIYPSHFLLETDCPDIPPVEIKNSLHVPANIVYNLRAASELLHESEEKIAEKTTENAVRIFNLPL